MLRLSTFGLRCFFVFAAFAVFFTSVNAQIFTSVGGFVITGSPQFRDPSHCKTITVSGRTTSSLVRSVSLNNIDHTWVGDLEVRVYRPGDAPPPATSGGVVMSPPDNAPCNLAGTYRFIDSGALSIDDTTVNPDGTFKPSCNDPADGSTQTIPPGDYRSSTYGGGVFPGPTTSVPGSFGVLSPAQANGNWLVCVFDAFPPADTGSVASVSIELVGPTAASVSVSGQVTAAGRGISGVLVRISDTSGNSRTAVTNSLGYYSFDNVEAGGVYSILAIDRRFRFEPPSIVLSVDDNVDDANFTGVASPKK